MFCDATLFDATQRDADSDHESQVAHTSPARPVVVVFGGGRGFQFARPLDDVADVVLVDRRTTSCTTSRSLRGLVEPSWLERIDLRTPSYWARAG